MTGFRSGREPDLPPVAARTFRGACHEAARAADGTVEQVTESAYPRNFHSAVIRAPSGRLTVLCNDSYPWVAFAEGVTGDLDPKAFADPPSWAGTFTGAGFVVMSRRLLASPLDAVDTGALGTAERLQIDSWRPPNVGETVFNSWD